MDIAAAPYLEVPRSSPALAFYSMLGSVAGPVIQANGRLSFEDDLRSGGLLYCVSQ